MIAAAVDELAASTSTDDEPLILPMGHYCATAGLLKQLELRRVALPLDWCRSTLHLWAHALSDGLRHLEDESLGEHENGGFTADAILPDRRWGGGCAGAVRPRKLSEQC